MRVEREESGIVNKINLREPSNFKVIKILQAYNIAIELRKIKKLAEASADF